MNAGKQSVGFGLLFIVIGGTIMGVLLQKQYIFHLFFMEQYQLFLSGKEYAKDLLSRPGGLIEYLSEYCIQFFNINYVGCICVVVFLLLIGLIIHYLLGHVDKKKDIVFVFEAGIMFFLFVNLLDIGFNFKGIVGYLFCLIALWIYSRIQSQAFLLRLLYGILLALLLFWIAAPFQTLFLITAGCMEIKVNGFNKGKSFLLLLLAGISLYVVNRYMENSYYRMYMVLDGVCSLRIIPGWTKYAAWVLLPVAIFLTPLLERLSILLKCGTGMVVMQGLIITTALVFLLPEYDDNWSLSFKQLNQYAVQEKWDDILDYCKKHPSDDYACLNYQNLALAEKGILADSLLHYPQKGKYGLFAPWDRTIYTALALQKICYNYGDIASAQRFAFEGNVSSVTKGFPETMKTLVRTNILQKEYRVALKYINYLQHTFSYKEWADKQCGYLFDADALENDSAYNGKRRYLQRDDRLILQNDLYMLADLDKGNKKLRDFVLCSYLLNKDLKRFLKKFDLYYKEMEKDRIPIVYYEAIMACIPGSPEVLMHYQIPENIKENFEIYASIYSSTQQPEERQKRLSLYHSNSYWYYYHYNEIDHE